MSSRVEYQRFRRGEHCTEEGCRSRKYYIEDGKKFCQKGHEQAVRSKVTLGRGASWHCVGFHSNATRRGWLEIQRQEISQAERGDRTRWSATQRPRCYGAIPSMLSIDPLETSSLVDKCQRLSIRIGDNSQRSLESTCSWPAQIGTRKGLWLRFGYDV